MCYAIVQEYGWLVVSAIVAAAGFVCAVLWAFDVETKEKVRKIRERR